jgi:RHS repeat-associated protein
MEIWQKKMFSYDQSGNLVKTVPPAGVNAKHSDADFLTLVAKARSAVKNGGAEALNKVVPTHTLVTAYRYNTLNQVVAQKTPDAGNTKFWYDILGRLAVSQNAQQRIDKKFSYTLYDRLGRITEVGQKPQTELPPSKDPGLLIKWLAQGGLNKEQVTKTSYDLSYRNKDNQEILKGIAEQKNLRNRVSFSMVFDKEPDPNILGTHSAATFYSYDIHGNVDTLLQDINEGVMKSTGNRFKKLVYEYDLISGKVNRVAYQAGAEDEFYHKYVYDAENRLTDVYTSTDSLTWQKDARYSYYKHGPLARSIIGQNQVQGTDYAYTLQGWLKGVNSTAVGDGKFDMGADGVKTGNIISPVARDAFGFALHYFSTANSKDYKPVGGGQPFASAAAAGFGFVSLYNGNIAAMAVNIPKVGEPLYYQYKYDALNRLVKMNTYKGLNPATNNWNVVSIDDFKEELSYDANGNIQTYKRNGKADKLDMDKMTYQYPKDANGKILNNRLRYVHDEVPAANYAEDIDSQTPLTLDLVNKELKPEQPTDNYVYDAIGNLIKDNKEGINKINWNVYGKIAGIEKQNSTITYRYDAGGNRITKTVGNTTTVYLRDAGGNVMSTYVVDAKINNGNLTQNEVHLYGSSRLGINEVNRDVQALAKADYLNKVNTFVTGNVRYELSNHLGNVMAVVSDRKHAVDDNKDGIIDYYTAEVVSATDYAPFGMSLNGRKFNNGNYLYGFNGKEDDKDISNGAQDYGMRINDVRLGRFLSVDPLQKKYPWYTPYQFAGNSPIAFTDLDGLERHYYIYQLNANTTQPVLQGVTTQTHEAGFWNSTYDAFHEQYINASTPYSRRTEYNGDLITDCSDVYVLQSGLVFKEFSSFAELKTTTSEAINKASAEASEGLTARIFYGDMALHYYSMPSDFFDAAGSSEYHDPLFESKLDKYTPELYPEVFPRYDGIKASTYAPKNTTVSGKDELVGYGELNGGVLSLGIYMKNGNTNEYLLKPKTINGAEVFEGVYSSVKAQGGIINTIQGNWNGSSDNLTTFNMAIKNGMSPAKAALETFTGQQASKRGYNKASVDYDASKVNADGTFEKATINFNK